ncbi:hypothetical protein [Deinococcus aestuarii]|uniref:hypothetical protein n=1 Tax=Deinococcus aestuarii TaxID=2774531 RepID=UPI001C0BC7B4|nr:hypothetical protein [Deinococcus aestuarii]
MKAGVERAIKEITRRLHARGMGARSNFKAGKRADQPGLALELEITNDLYWSLSASAAARGLTLEEHMLRLVEEQLARESGKTFKQVMRAGVQKALSQQKGS